MQIGILTDKPIRKYPLRAANLAMVLKAYAVASRLPYTVDNHNFDELSEYRLYLTEGGLEWLYNLFKQYSLAYLRSTFQFIFSAATEADVQNPEQYAGYNNFRGTIGDMPKAGTKQKAILVRRVGRVDRKYEFNSILEAREEFFNLSRYFPADQFKLYRIRKNTKRGKVYYYEQEIPLVLEKSKRGVAVNLPHLKE
jgi:hypothetical protein